MVFLILLFYLDKVLRTVRASASSFLSVVFYFLLWETFFNSLSSEVQDCSPRMKRLPPTSGQFSITVPTGFFMELSTSIRQSSDTRFYDVLSRLRASSCTDADSLLLYTRHFTDEDESINEGSQWKAAPILTARNVMAAAFSERSIFGYGAPSGTFRIHSVPVFSRRTYDVVRSQRAKAFYKIACTGMLPLSRGTAFSPPPVLPVY